LYIACSEWWLRFLDDSQYNILGLNILRSGFRKVVFSVIIMIIVLFFSKGIMGDKELSVRRLWEKIHKKKVTKKQTVGEGAENE